MIIALRRSLRRQQPHCRNAAGGAGMAIVRTVAGDVDAGQLGPTTMHEHIFGDFTVWQEDPGQTASLATVAVEPDAPVDMSMLGIIHRNPVVIRDNLRIGDDEALALAEVRTFADAGGDCLVEVTCCGDVAADGVTNMGRNAPGLRRIADQTGLKIVAGTGFYLEGTHPDYVRTDSVAQLAARMTRDLTEGIGDTGIRAGIIGEIGTSTFTDREQKVLRACAAAHLATGAAISLHTHVGCPTGEQSVRLLLEEGVAASRIIVGHMDENLVSFQPGLAHLDYHRRVADMGVYIQYDTFGAEWYYDQNREPMDAERACAVAALISEGHLDQILLGQDIWLKNCYKHYGGLGYDHLFTGVKALLTQAGVTDAQFRQILIGNPRKALALSTSR
jgi:phosphotriesterase-related protein